MSFDDIFQRVKLTASVMGATAKAVLVNLRGLATDDSDEGEVSPREVLYGVLGVLVRPADPTDAGYAEGFGVRREDRMTAVSTIDRRICRARGDLPVGSVGLGGYGGQHITLEAGGEAGGDPKITIEIPGSLRIVLDASTTPPTITINGLVAFGLHQGDEASAQPVALAPTVAGVNACITAIGALKAAVGAPAGGVVVPTPLGASAQSTAVKA